MSNQPLEGRKQFSVFSSDGSSSNFSAIELSSGDTHNIEFCPLPPKIQKGALIADFAIVEEINSGGMSAIYRAYQSSRDREVALKVLSPHLAHMSKAVERFEYESQLAARIAHPGIVPVYTQGFDGVYYYYAMKLMREPTLGELIETSFGKKNEVSFRDAANLLADLARTVAALHASGLVHHDIKPANLFLLPEGKLVLADFGVATELRSGEECPTDDAPLGTPAYMAPERFVDSSRNADVRHDVYSLGMTLYELVAGVLPFPDASDEEIARLKLMRKPPSPRHAVPEIPLGLEAVIRQALEVHVELRYQNAIELACDLERFANNRRTNTRTHPGLGGYSEKHYDGTDDTDPAMAPLG